ncbi:PEP-CTERM sorting domain-containing protein [Roseateles sp.]|uniref:PEP-CTERM sorting domain-containing protein n=1 Tax=Roseateles sp. TaxID=1971397 RepID=UPI0025F9FEED|nr:PEP-CTERM sorting domain-containing protein [Roseateles sp.]
MTSKKTNWLIAPMLALTLSGAAYADSWDVRYESTDGIIATTSGTQNGYLTGAMTFVNTQGSSFEAFCVELAQGHAPSSAGFLSYTKGSFTIQQEGLLQSLFSSSYVSVSTAEQKAAFQVAVWKIMEETSPAAKFDLSGGSFQFWYLSETSTQAQDASFAALANSYLLAASNYSGPAQYQLTKLVNGTYQDFVVANPVPEPETYALLLAGLGAVGLVVRRRRVH